MDEGKQQKIVSVRVRRITLSFIVLVCVAVGAQHAAAQAPALPPDQLPPDAQLPPDTRIVTGGPQFRLGILAWDLYSYQVHPFKTLTGEPAFDKSFAANGTSADFGSPDSDSDSNFFDRALHVLPPFRLDYSWGLNFAFLKGIGIGLDYVHLFQTDTVALEGAVTFTNPLPRFEMDTYLISIPVRFYAFDPTQPGINVFLGLSLGVINGNLLVRADASAGTPEQAIHFSEGPVGTTRMGLEMMGEDFGFRFELTLVNAREVVFESNPFPNQSAVTVVDMSGSILQLTLLLRFE